MNTVYIKINSFIFQVWYAAVTQSFFSLSVGFGPIISYSSHNQFEHNTYRDALIISVSTYIFYILVIFGT